MNREKYLNLSLCPILLCLQSTKSLLLRYVTWSDSHYCSPPTAAASILSNHANWFVHWSATQKIQRITFRFVLRLHSARFSLCCLPVIEKQQLAKEEIWSSGLQDFRSAVQRKISWITEVDKWLHGLMECCKTASSLRRNKVRSDSCAVQSSLPYPRVILPFGSSLVSLR